MEAYILVECDVGCAAEAAHRIERMPFVSSVDVVVGAYDLVARSEAPSIEEVHSELLMRIKVDPCVTRAIMCPLTPAVRRPSEPEPLLVDPVDLGPPVRPLQPEPAPAFPGPISVEPVPLQTVGVGAWAAEPDVDPMLEGVGLLSVGFWGLGPA